MRIQLVGINFAPERTGIAPYTTALARHLSEKHDVTVVTGVPHYPDWTVPAEHRAWRREEWHDRLRVIRLSHYVPKDPSVMGRGAYEFTWATRAAVVGRRIPTDLVIAVVPALLGAHAARLVSDHHRAPLGVVVQDIMGTAAAQSGMRGGRLVTDVTSRIERTALARATGVSTIHPRLAELLAAHTRVPPTVIYNWTHVPHRPKPGRVQRAKLGWHDDEVVALHSGNMGAKQNLETVVDAARAAARGRQRIKFVLAGGGNRRTALQRYAVGCGNLDFHDSVADDEYMDLLAAADVLLVNERPGMREMSLPSKLTSYLVAGRPIVAATDHDSATAEFVRACGGGVVTPAGDADRLLDAVTTIAADGQTADRLVSDGHTFALEHLTEAAAMQAYDDWIDELAATGWRR